jgi:hypothetical protein
MGSPVEKKGSIAPFACALYLAALLPAVPCAGQAPDTASFTASGISISLVLHDRGALPLRAEAERVLRAGLEELTGVFGGPPRDPAGPRSR